MAEYRIDFPFIAVPMALLTCDLDASAIAAYVALRSFVRYGEPVTVTDEAAATRGGLGKRAFVDARTRLRDSGWVTWERTGRENVYTLLSTRIDAGPPVLTHATAEVRSAESAHQIGGKRTSEVHQTPIASIGQKEHKEPKEQPSAPATPTPFDLAPHIDLHHEMFPGSVAPASRMARPFKDLWTRGLKTYPDLPPERVRQQILDNQRRYLEDLKARGGVEFLDYAKFAATFSEWGKVRGRGKRAPAAPVYDESGNAAAERRMETT